jgi:hypothetical protein
MNMMSSSKRSFRKAHLFFAISLFATISACGGGGGNGDTGNAAPTLPTNIAPTANAGSDQTVNEQVLVHLSGSGSDSDGTISTYNWTQTAGPAVKIHSSDTADISFDGPAAAKQIVLTFQLAVTDNAGATATDSVDITVLSNPTSITDLWEPSLKSECVAYQNVSPVSDSIATTLTEVGTRLFEPSVVFSDQAFTWFERSEPGPASISSDLLQHGDYDVVDGDDKSLLFDDGTHGDSIAGDGLFTRACVFVPAAALGGNQFVETLGLWMLDASLRNSETANYIAKGIRANNAGFFIELGDTYQTRLANFSNISWPGGCQACAKAWQLAGDVFDFLVLSTRDPIGGAGYTRVHDHIRGAGFNPPCDPRSYCYDIIDGQEHEKLTGIITMQWPGIGGLNHELGHGFLGTETRDFPAAGPGAWNAGDLIHFDSDITATGELSGPFWDPIRGWPYSVQMANAEGERYETYLTVDDNGIFRLAEIDDDRRIWDDIFLYMMGLLSPEDVTETYYKLLNPILDNCVTEEAHTFCTSDLVFAEEVIPFTVTDFIARFGTLSVPSIIDPMQIQMGVLNISDRPHTEAEIVWFSKVYRDFVTATEPTGQWSTGTSWRWATKGLSTISIDAEMLVQ